MAVELRSEARASLLTALETGVTQAQEHYPYLPTNPAGLSPYITIESDGAEYTWTPADYNRFRFVVGAWVVRDDPEDAEDLLDTLAQQIGTTVQSWHNATFWQPSRPDYVDGDNYPGQWRVEWFFVEVDWE